MERTGLKIALACAFGALCGFMVMLGFGHTLFSALIGTAVGGVVGYLSIDFREVVETTKKVLSQLPKRKRSKFTFKMYFWTIMAFTSVAPLYIISCLSSYWQIRMKPHEAGTWICSAFCAASIIFIIYATIHEANKLIEEAENGETDKELRRAKSLCFLNVWFILFPKWIFRTMVSAPRRIANFSRAVWKIIVIVFVEIHSHERVVCLGYASIGAVISFLVWRPIAWAALAGMLAGAAFGYITHTAASYAHIKSTDPA